MPKSKNAWPADGRFNPHRLTSWALILVIASALLIPAGSSAADLTLSIIHTNDFHARLEPVTLDGSRCRPADAEAHRCYGGVARLVTEIDRLRAEGPNPLVLDAGDRFQGSLYYTYYKSAALKPFFELLHYQAMTLGNHEFDDGPAELARFLTGLPMPVISANVDVTAEPTLAGRFGGTTVLTVGGSRIGLIGLTTPSTATNSKPGPNVHFTDPVVAARAGVAALQAQGIRRIIVLSHLGLGEDEKLAAAVDGISVIVGGHTHLLLRSKDSLAVGPSPRVVRSPAGNPVLIVQAYFAGIYLGFLQVTLDDAGVPTHWQGEPVLLDDSIPEDATAHAFVEALGQPLVPLLAQPVGTTRVPLSGARAVCRFAECNLGDLIADSLLEQTRSQGSQVAIINGGAIRASLPVGPISLGHLLEVLPFANTVATFALTGADLRAALENGVSAAESPSNDGTGRFPQVAGLRLTWDAAAPAGRRLVSVQVRQADGRYVDLDSETTYHLVTIDYLRTGGDGYTVFRDHAIDPYDGGPLLSDALAATITDHSPVTIATEGRITRLH
jgi:5'-nucleotidase